MALGYQHLDSYPYTYEDNTVKIGSILYSRQSNYLVQSILGEGSFGKVVKCLRLQDNKIVAVKVMKKEENYSYCVTHELQALLKLSSLDPDICNIVRLHASFSDRGNFCFVFEYLDKSLFDFIKENDFRPLPLQGIRLIVQQLAVALQSLRSVGLTHCDIKLDNIMLVDHEKQPFRIKLIDFGLAHVASSLAQGSVIQPLPYRPPEVLLGLPLTEAADMWSLGCVVEELHLMDRLFDGNHEFDVMRSIVELLGPPPNRMLDAGIKTHRYFREGSCPWTQSWELKEGSSREAHKLLNSLDDILSVFPTEGCDNADLSLFVDMLKKMLDLDPATRITPAQLLQHGFLTNAEVGTACKEPEVTASKKDGQSFQSQCENTQHNQASQLQRGPKRKRDCNDDDSSCHDAKKPKVQSRVTPRKDAQMNVVNSSIQRKLPDGEDGGPHCSTSMAVPRLSQQATKRRRKSTGRKGKKK